MTTEEDPSEGTAEEWPLEANPVPYLTYDEVMGRAQEAARRMRSSKTSGYSDTMAREAEIWLKMATVMAVRESNHVVWRTE